MIETIRLDGKRVWINPHQIESIEQNPDTTLVMLSGKKIIIRDTPDVIIERIIAYRNKLGDFKNEE